VKQNSSGDTSLDRMEEELRLTAAYYGRGGTWMKTGAGIEDPMITMTEHMTDRQFALFQSEMAERKKSGTAGVLLALLLGGVGAHKFYMGQVGWGVVYVLFFWTFIPGLIALVECFFMPGRVREYNKSLSLQIADRITSGRRGY
jgi:TM2 domain-containing membrane protein YozV